MLTRTSTLFVVLISSIVFSVYGRAQQPQASSATSADQVLSMAKKALRENRYKDAINNLSNGVKSFPEDKRLYLELGRAYLYDRQDDRAIDIFRQVLHADSRDRSTKLELARALGYQRKFAESDQLYRDLLQTNGEDEAASLGLVRNLIHERKLPEARERVEQALVFHPDSLRLQEFRDELRGRTAGPEAAAVAPGLSQLQAWTIFLSDSAGNRVMQELQRVDYGFNDTLSARVDLGERFLSSSKIAGSGIRLFSGLAQFRAKVQPSLLLSAGLGSVYFSDGASRPLYRADIEYHPAERLWISGAFARTPVAPTSTAAGFHVMSQGVLLRLDWQPKKWQINGSFGRHSYSDGNYRKEENLEILRWFGRSHLQFGAGYSFRHLAFDESLGHGYFNPLAYKNNTGVTGVRFRLGKSFRGDYMTRLGAESVIPGSYRPAIEVALQNRWQLTGKWEIKADYFFYHLAQSSGAFRTHVGRFGISYRF